MKKNTTRRQARFGFIAMLMRNGTALNSGVHETLDAGVIAKLPQRTRDLIGELMT